MIRPSAWAVALCAAALWLASAAAELPAQAGPTQEAPATVDSLTATARLFLPPSLPAADSEPHVPRIYRLPRVEQPATNGEQPVDNPPDQLAGEQPIGRISVTPELPEAEEGPTVAWDGCEPSVDEPVPENLDVDADPKDLDVDADDDAPAEREDQNAHQDTDQANAADDHPSDPHPVGGSPVEPAVEAGVLPYTPTEVELTAQVLPAVQHACGLAQRGAVYAAQTEFVKVLRRIAQAKDAQLGTDEHSRALAAGLRALDEADDFVPRGTQLEAELVVRALASSHRTPVLAGREADVRPQEAVALYLSYAQQQLGRAVAGQQAGSMALHGLGKLYSRMAQRTDGDVQQVRKAMTMYLAALEACPQNHLAANELGVLLAQNGHYTEAEAMFRRAVELAPSATGYHNLAVAQRKLNQPQQAIANGQQAERLAAWERANGEVSRRKGIQWVPPGELARAAQQPPAPIEPAAEVRGLQPSTTTTAPAVAARSLQPPPFAPPPLGNNTTNLTPPIRVARPDPAQTPNRTWWP